MRLLVAGMGAGALARSAHAARAARAATSDAGAAGQAAAPGNAALKAAVNLSWQVFTTAEGSGQRFVARSLPATAAATQPVETDISVFVDTGHHFQTVFGFGGAVTDAVAEVYAKLKPEAQKALLTAYYDPRQGIGYSIARISIHSSDFGSGSFTYVKDGDRSLNSFSIEHDMKYRVPLLRQILALGAAQNNTVRVFASPWSAPGWMKTNNSMLQGGSLLPEYRDTWAQYVVRFVKAYEKTGIPIWGMTVQNEPMAKQTWDSMIYTAEDETRYLASALPSPKPAWATRRSWSGTTTATCCRSAPTTCCPIRKHANTSGASATTGTRPGPAASRCIATSPPCTRPGRT
jgi:glucosylceramidase